MKCSRIGKGSIAFVVCFSALSSGAQQTVHAAAKVMVEKYGSFSSLEAALNEAPIGATILVPGGNYVGHFTITKPVKLIGVGQPILDGQGQGTILTVKSSDVTIQGFSLKHSGSDLGDSPAGVRIDSVHNVTVTNNNFSDMEYGFYIAGSTNCHLSHNRIDGKANLLPEDRGDGFRLWNSSNIFVDHNEVHNTRDGMEFEFSNNNQVTANIFKNLRYGLHYMYSNHNDFYGNEFANDVAGGVPMYSSYITFYHNVFMHMSDYRAYGVLLKDDHDCKITNNLIFDNTVGMFIDESYHNTITNNDIVDNGIALRVLGNSWDNTFSENNLIDNMTQVGKISQGLPNEWSFQGKGNYWSDYVGYDPAKTGVGRLPYFSRDYFASLVSQFPILLQFSSSPAITALKSADNQLPLAQIAGIEDAHPLMKPVPIPPQWTDYLSTRNRNWPLTMFASILAMLVGGSIILRFNRPKRRRST